MWVPGSVYIWGCRYLGGMSLVGQGSGSLREEAHEVMQCHVLTLQVDGTEQYQLDISCQILHQLLDLAIGLLAHPLVDALEVQGLIAAECLGLVVTEVL